MTHAKIVLQAIPDPKVLNNYKAFSSETYGDKMDTLFKSYMCWFGNKYSQYELIEDDFDANPNIIQTATIIFANNFLFDTNVNSILNDNLFNLPDGTQIVTPKRLRRNKKWEINAR